jgi:predicted ATPase
MNTPIFVGRESELELLKEALLQGALDRGSVLFIEGEAGTGKSSLLQEFQDRARALPGAKKMHFVLDACDANTGGQNANQPFVEMLKKLRAADKTTASLAEFFLSLARENAGDWLNAIPGIGPVIGAGIKTTLTASQLLLARSGKPSGQSESLAREYVRTIEKIAPRFAPLVMIIEDAHWIDDTSCSLLLRLAGSMPSLPLVILVTYRPNEVTQGHPLHKIRQELVIKNLVRILPLGGLREEDIENYLARRYGSSLNTNLAAWLLYHGSGHPMFITEYLGLLEQDQIIRRVDGAYILDGDIDLIAGEWQREGRLAKASIPKSIEKVLEQRIERLMEEDRFMLQVGAVQGEHFMSVVLADLLKKDELDLLRRLGNVVEQHRVISLYTGEYLTKHPSDVYAFEHALLQQELYRKLTSPHLKILYHKSIAEQLESMVQDPGQFSRKLILAIAHHYDRGAVPQKAAHFYLLAAQSLMADGASEEATEICKRALRNIRQVPNADRQHAEILEMLLAAARWRDQPADLEEMEALEEEAVAVTLRTGDKAMLARIKYFHSMRIGQKARLAEWLAALQEALDLMRQAGDRLGEIFIMFQLGQEMRGQDFEAGFALQQQAYQLFQDHIANTQAPLSLELKHKLHTIQNRLGLAKFDRGEYGEALPLLEASIAGLRANRFYDGLVEGLNFLGQLYMSLGQFEKAEAALEEALNIVKDDDIPHYYTSYNLSLLGKVYLEWERPEMAVEPMLQGWQESQVSANKVLLPLIKNYYAELLMHARYSGHDLGEAERLLAANAEEARDSGYLRSSITALSLRSLVALQKNQIDDAVQYSTQAINFLQELGTLPALRKEEILFNHYQVLRETGKAEEARLFLEQACEVLQQKAHSIKEDPYRQSFLERVPISRAILSAMHEIN